MPNHSHINNHLIPASASVRDALGSLNRLSGSNMTLFVVGDDPGIPPHSSLLLGSLTDGDIRRALTSGASLDTLVAEIANASCLRVEDDSQRYEVSRQAAARGITLLPVLRDGRVVDLIDLRSRHALLPVDAVLMAGGRGERLRPLTLSTPKPLLPIGGRPIIDYNVEALRSYGIENIFVTVNYLKEQIIAHFSGHASLPGVVCVEEPRRLGTMGSLSLVDGLRQEHVLVMNSDLLTTVDFARMFQHHVDSDSDITMATVPYNVSVPYAIVHHMDGLVTALSEKPTYTYMANGGIYMMKRTVADSIPTGEYLDAPDLLEQVIARGGRVTSFPIDGTWIDIGSPEDFRTADTLMSNK